MFPLAVMHRGAGLISEKTEAMYAELNERAEGANNSFFFIYKKKKKKKGKKKTHTEITYKPNNLQTASTNYTFREPPRNRNNCCR